MNRRNLKKKTVLQTRSLIIKYGGRYDVFQRYVKFLKNIKKYEKVALVQSKNGF